MRYAPINKLEYINNIVCFLLVNRDGRDIRIADFNTLAQPVRFKNYSSLQNGCSTKSTVTIWHGS